jgi:CubicO group peptidase (beta-lactamase class C family)
VNGFCDSRFVPVREAFAGNFALYGEVGAAVHVIVDNRVVVDLWGGHANQAGTRPWQPHTLVNMFSIGKAMSAACAARLAGEGRLDPDRPVAAYWPGFGVAGKGAITVAQVLSHQAGLPAVRQPLPADAMLDWDLMTSVLAAEEPWWPPGTAHGYHANTFGYLVGELVRRVTGSTLGQYLRAEITGPLGADVHIGLPASEDHRVAEFQFPASFTFGAFGGSEHTVSEHLMEYNAYANPAGLSGIGVVNTRAWRAVEIPSTNGHASARGVAQVYRMLAAGGSLDGRRFIDSGALQGAVTETVYGDDLVLHRPTRFGLGFQLTQPERPLGPSPRAFGHFGAGGSLGFCDPDACVAFGYVMNLMGPRWQNPRNRALIDAVYESLA